MCPSLRNRVLGLQLVFVVYLLATPLLCSASDKSSVSHEEDAKSKSAIKKAAEEVAAAAKEDPDAEIDVPVNRIEDAERPHTSLNKVYRGPVDKNELIQKDPYGRLIDSGGIDVGFIHAFVASLSVIIVSELGDKTFFIAAIMAMRHSRIVVYSAAMCALGLMTVLSALVGFATTIIPRWLTYYVSSGLFAIFGLKMLREGYLMSPDEGQDEYEETQAEIKKKEELIAMESKVDAESGVIQTRHRRLLYTFFSQVFLEAFTLTFLAEWGDRSQIATIILAAREEVIGVILGGTLGHAFCTGLAVLGGRFIAQKISIKTVTLIGGVVFIIFALSAFFIDPDA